MGLRRIILQDVLGIYPQYTYKQRVSILGGFYKGQSGTVKGTVGDDFYHITLDGESEFSYERIHASQLEGKQS